MRLVVDENIPHAREALGPFGELSLLPGRSLTPEAVRDADALFVRSVTRVDRALLEGSKVRFVATATAGTEHVDEPWLASRGIRFASAPGSNAASVVDWVLAAFALDGLFSRKEKPVVGVVGCGQVGGRLVRRLKALGWTVLRVDPPLEEAGAPGPWHRLADLREADAITFHVPLVEQGPHGTRKLISRDFLSSISKSRGPLLLNACRGEVSDEDALLDALESGRIRALALDVYENEPLPRLDLLKRCFVTTPHVAGYAQAAKLKGTAMVASAYAEFRGESSNFDLDRAAGALGKGRLPAFSSLSPARRREEAILAAYPLSRDSEALQALSGLPDAERAAGFDRLRKTYPLRLEFDAFSAPEGSPPEWNATWKALGFGS